MKRGAGKINGFVAAAFALVFAASAAAQSARPPVPRAEIVDTIRGLAAQMLHIKKSDVDLHSSLSAKGMTESQLNELVIDINQELGVTISSRAVFEAKQAEPVQPLSVLRLADMVEQRMLRDTPFPE